MEYFFTTSIYGTNLTSIQKSIAVHYNCVSTPCSTQYLAYLQWGSSAVTNNLPSDIIPVNESVLSISQWNSWLGETPEFFAFAATYNLTNISFSLEAVEIIFSNGMGGLLEYKERMRFIESMNESSITYNSRFNLNANQSLILYDYIRNVVVDYIFDDVFINKTPYEFLWGYEDEYIKRTVFFFFNLLFKL